MAALQQRNIRASAGASCSGRPFGVCPPRSSVVMRSTGWADSKATNAEKAMFGQDFGARDPFAAEIESNFGEKVLGNYNTEHIIKIPSKIKNAVGLTAMQCQPAAELSLLEEKDLNLLKQQVPGWRVVATSAGHQGIRHEWRARTPEAAAELHRRVEAVAGASSGHVPAVMTVNGDMVIAELCTPSVGGLSVNDFVVAAKVNEMDLKDLLPPPRKRFWA